MREVQDVTKDPNGIERELALVKVRGTGGDRVEALRVSDIFHPMPSGGFVDAGRLHVPAPQQRHHHHHHHRHCQPWKLCLPSCCWNKRRCANPLFSRWAPELRSPGRILLSHPTHCLSVPVMESMVELLRIRQVLARPLLPLQRLPLEQRLTQWGPALLGASLHLLRQSLRRASLFPLQ